METIAHHQLIIAVVGAVIAAIALVIGMPTLLSYIATRRKEKRQARVKEVLLKNGPTNVGEFMLLCPRLSQSERDKALLELSLAGEIVPYQDHAGRTTWSFKIHPHEIPRRSG